MNISPYALAVQRACVLAAGFAIAFGSTNCFAEKMDAKSLLRSPFDVQAIREAHGLADLKPFKCNAPPKPVKNLIFESIYSKESANASVVDAKAHEEYAKATKTLRDYETKLNSMANRYVRSNPARPEIAACVQDWIVTWARGKALQGDVNRTGEFVRKWTLASIASAWLQIKSEDALDAGKRLEIEDFLRKTAEVVIKDYSTNTHIKSRQNNHLYWAAWAVMQTAIALDDVYMFQWALRRAQQGIHDINDDGALPLEMARGRMALNYHCFAALPLFSMAEAALANHYNLYKENKAGLFRLGERILSGIKNPTWFQEETEELQDKTRISNANLSWLEIYYRRTQNPDAFKLLKEMRPMYMTRVGGNATLLYGP